ncbi:MAG: hypothetical protein KGI08_07585, partial [Thaumarchaeota archaeon]|nr:hypothetical protein [Nitrososphaerota archaeon]
GQELNPINAGISLVDDRTQGSQISDPSGYLQHVSIITEQQDENTVIHTFQFKVSKAMPDHEMLIRVWDNKLHSADVRVHGAIQFGVDAPVVVKVDPNVVTFDSIEAVHAFLEKNYYQSPELIAHVHSTASMFMDSPGKVYWTANTSEKTLTVHAVDGNGNVVWEQSTPLLDEPMHPKGFGQDVLPHTGTSFAPGWIAGGAYNQNAFIMPANLRG